MTPGPEQHAAVAAAARRLAREGLVVGSAGNVSLRVGDAVLVTASGVDLSRCGPEHVVLVGSGEGTPTSEVDLHLGVQADTGAAAVVHTHAPSSTAVACVLDELPVLHYQQMLLGGPVRVAPYATFGTPELAGHVRAALVGRTAALLANHGSVAVGATLDEAVDRALLLEWLAALHLRASALGTPRVLSETQQHDVVAAALARGYGDPAPARGGQQ